MDCLFLTRWRVTRWAVISRIAMIVAMTISCQLLPDFVDPTSGVLEFDLRLRGDDDCFCLLGHACDSGTRQTPPQRGCAMRRDLAAGHDSWIYRTLLPPFTRWDAARFLSLASNPHARQPPSSPWAGTCSDKDDATTCEASISSDEAIATRSTDQIPQDSSEHAHAFLPLVPFLYRATALLLLRALPPSFLPSTFEAVIVLASLLLNFVFFLWGAILLFELTIIYLQRDADSHKQRATKVRFAEFAAFLYCINPSGVFFTTAYSESTFALLLFGGHILFASRQPWLAIIPWMLAAYARSNGTTVGLAIFLQCLSRILTLMRYCSQRDPQSPRRMTFFAEGVGVIMCYATMIVAVLIPVFYHDWIGVQFHCGREGPKEWMNEPSWCHMALQEDLNLPRFGFSLYAHVQRKHWNVGFFRYYTWKKLPLFFCAAPVLLVALCATTNWIRVSWERWRKKNPDAKSWTLPLLSLVRWAVDALVDSDLSLLPSPNVTETVSKDENPHTTTNQTEASSTVHVAKKPDFFKLVTIGNDDDMLLSLLGTPMLGHYATLAAVGVVGLTVAHVEISTRLIASSCPAFYWYLTALLVEPKPKGALRGVVRGLLLFYLSLFNVLGILMHVNWLPWT